MRNEQLKFIKIPLMINYRFEAEFKEQTMFEPRLKFLKINEKKVNLINWFCKPVKIMFKKTSSHSRPRVDPLLPRHLLSSYCTVKSVSMD